MDKLANSLLLFALVVLTLTCAYIRITPMTWIVLYGGWLFWMQRHARMILRARAEREAALVPVRIRRDDELPPR